MKSMETKPHFSCRPVRFPSLGQRSWLSLKFGTAFIIALFLSVFTIQLGDAQTDTGSMTRITSSGREASERIDLSVGKSVLIDLPRDVKDVMVGNPKIANAVVRSTRNIFIIGIAGGATSVFAMDAQGNQIAAFDITVGNDLNILRQTLQSAMPGSQISVKAAGDSVLLVGSVASASEASQATDIANAFISNSGGSASGVGKVINALTIRGKDQVMIKVSIAEIQRTVMKQLGIENQGTWKIGGLPIVNSTENPFYTSGAAATGNFLSVGDSNRFTLRAMEKAGVMRTLAEPTLTAISGETATFLVGGEIPVLGAMQCSGASCTQTVEFKKFGVSLTFTPIVMSEGRMSLRIATEVSEIDPTNSIKTLTATLPGFRVRRSETTVELPSGGTLVTAGLIQQQGQQSLAGLPGLKNIPILGTLFRSREYQRQETELMISVTPYIATPMLPGAVKRPTDGFIDASDPQGVLLGRFNKIYGTARTTTKAKGAGPERLRGRPGFIND